MMNLKKKFNSIRINEYNQMNYYKSIMILNGTSKIYLRIIRKSF